MEVIPAVVLLRLSPLRDTQQALARCVNICTVLLITRIACLTQYAVKAVISALSYRVYATWAIFVIVKVCDR
jgi:hypothetical protein